MKRGEQPQPKRPMEPIEVLAPAGSPESLRAAVFAGADAVYLGGALFSARASAANFSREELTEAVRFCRTRGVKVYAAVNTLIKEREVTEALEFFGFLCSIPVDGVLVQDIGLFRLMRRLAPEMPLHCSTQMSLHTPEGVRLAEALGAERAVLARELSLSEIREIRNACGIQLEAFVHGALCMSVSGQCCFSAMLGSRSGNRGRCAQPCRLPFETPQGKSGALSLKDLSFLSQLSRLAEAGICSAKIEGRMKRPEYVAAAVSACRRAADGEPIPPELLEDLEAVFSRSGFTDGYLTGRRGPEMFGIRTREDVESGTPAVFARLHELYRNERRAIPLTGEFSCRAGERAVFDLSDRQGHRVTVESSEAAQPGEAAVLEEINCERLLSKLGGTPYYLEHLSLHLDGKAMLRAAEINAMRRQAVELLSEERARSKPPVAMEPYQKELPPAGKKPPLSETMRFRGIFTRYEQVPENAGKLERVYLPLTEETERFLQLRERGIRPAVFLPRSLFGGEAVLKKLEDKIEELAGLGVSEFLCGTLDAVALCRKHGVAIHGGSSLNVYNSESLETLRQLGVTQCELSWELTLEEAGQVFTPGTETGLMLYGRQPLMLVRCCPLGSGRCLNCREPGYLSDRKGARFPVLCMRAGNFTSVELFNSVPLQMCDKLREITCADFGVFRFTVENSVESGQVIEGFFRQEKPQGDYTRGLFYRGVT